MKNVKWIFQLRPQDSATVQRELWEHEAAFSLFSSMENPHQILTEVDRLV